MKFYKYSERAHLNETMSSRALMKATDLYHEELLKLQMLQKEFVASPKDNTEKRNELKKQIVAQHKIAKDAERRFEKALGDEDDDIVMETSDVIRMISEGFSKTLYNKIESALRGSSVVEIFLDAAEDVMQEISLDEEVGPDEIMEYLHIKLDELGW